MNTRYSVPLMVAAALFARPASGAFSWDDADSDPQEFYRAAGQYMGLSEGVGFEPWLPLNPGWGSGGSYLVQQGFRPEQPSIQLDYSWGMNGTYAVGRGLVEELSHGTWTFLAAHNVYQESGAGFSGFNLKLVKSVENADFSEGELIRFGFNRGTDYEGNYNTGICYSINGDSNYHYLGGDSWAGDTLKYSVTWNGNGGYYLSVENQTQTDEETLRMFLVRDFGAAVAMFGTAVYGSGLDAQSITFDAYNASIPEPAAALPAFAFLVVSAVLWRTTSRNRQPRS